MHLLLLPVVLFSTCIGPVLVVLLLLVVLLTLGVAVALVVVPLFLVLVPVGVVSSTPLVGTAVPWAFVAVSRVV